MGIHRNYISFNLRYTPPFRRPFYTDHPRTSKSRAKCALSVHPLQARCKGTSLYPRWNNL